MSKNKIIGRLLLLEQITFEEAELLMNNDELSCDQRMCDLITKIEKLADEVMNSKQIQTEFPNIGNGITYYPFDVCPCNPINGGSGICGCTLNGSVTYKSDVPFTYTQSTGKK